MKCLKKYKLISILVLCAYFPSLITPPPAQAGWNRGGYNSGATTPAPGPTSQQPTSDDNQLTCGKPINAFTGEETYECQDLFIPGPGMNLDIRHLYRSGYFSN